MKKEKYTKEQLEAKKPEPCRKPEPTCLELAKEENKYLLTLYQELCDDNREMINELDKSRFIFTLTLTLTLIATALIFFSLGAIAVLLKNPELCNLICR